MTMQEEREFHDLVVTLEVLTRDSPWEAMRYEVIGRLMKRLADYCAVCDCQRARSRAAERSW